VWSVNLKKGVLSAFQQTVGSSGENVTETDVVGRCDTQYTPTGSGWGRATYRKVSRAAGEQKQVVMERNPGYRDSLDWCQVQRSGHRESRESLDQSTESV
jgi:hypothetical protein